MTPGDPRRVLVLRALGLGDLCTAVPALRALRRSLPGHRLLLAAPQWQAPLATLAGVDEVVEVDGLGPLPAELGGVELAVNLHGRGPRSSALLAALSPGRLVAFAHPEVPGTTGGPEWRREEHEVQRWCRLLDESGIPADPGDLRLPAPDAASPVASGAVVVHPGAADAGRRWPADRFARVVHVLCECEHTVVLTGTRDERPLCEEVLRLARRRPDRERGEVVVLAGHTELAELAATVATARAVLCNDTGVAHLATAYGTPSVVLFGPTPPDWWGPPPGGPHRVLWAGRTGDPHAAAVHPGLLDIGVAEVLDALGAALGPIPLEGDRVRV